MARTRNRRREPEEETPPLEEIVPSPEEVELSDFLEGLGPQGISEVSLYRILPSGKQRFITSGPPGQFSELYVQAQFGEGDYLARAKLNGHWYKSKSFSRENDRPRTERLHNSPTALFRRAPILDGGL
jgi:hypothetical protein